MKKLNLSYIEDSGALGYQFFQVPKLLLENEAFDEIDFGAKILYSLMLNRISLSVSNNFRDDEGKLYIIYTVDNVQKELRCSNKTAIKLLKQLEDIGLIDKKRQGQGKPTLIFLRDFKEVTNGDVKKCNNYTSEKENIKIEVVKETNTDFQKCKKYTSRSEDTTLLEVKKVHTIYNNNIYPDNRISIYQSKDNTTNECAMENEVSNFDKIDKIDVLASIKNNIDYEEIKRDGEYSIDAVNNIVELISSVVVSGKKSLVVGKESINAQMVKDVLMALERKHIEYVIDCVSRFEGEIKNINAYLLTALYNARNTVDIYWQQKLNREIPALALALEKKKKCKDIGAV